MKKKRPTPKRLPSGSWRVQVMVNGQRISVTDPDKNVAQARAMALQAGILEQEDRKAAPTLSRAIDRYIEDRSAVLSPSTIRGYGFIRDKRFPALMKMKINEITKRDLQTAINRETAAGVSPKTITNAARLVSSVLRDNDLPVPKINLPQKITPQREYIQQDEISRLLSVIDGDPYETQILLALWLGLRRGEIYGLCWDCVDFDEKTISIRRVMVLDSENRWILRDGAKTEKSQRTIPCPDYILDRFRKLGPKKNGLVFASHPGTLAKHIRETCKKAGITSTTAHGLRHTNAAIMRQIGVSDSHAMQRGGWTEERTYKQVYSYVFGARANEDDAIIDTFFHSKLHTDLHPKKTNPLTNKG